MGSVPTQNHGKTRYCSGNSGLLIHKTAGGPELLTKLARLSIISVYRQIDMKSVTNWQALALNGLLRSELLLNYIIGQRPFETLAYQLIVHVSPLIRQRNGYSFC